MHIRKQVVRSRARAARSGLSPAEIETRSRQICGRARDIIGDTSPVLLYASKSGEVATNSLITTLLDAGTEVVLPIIERETVSLRLSYLRDMAVLSESTFQVPEPVGHEIPARASDVSMVILPMLAFDRQGHRLGYGAGYYDRFLAGNPGLTRVGLAFSCQEVLDIPQDPYDMQVHYVVTEHEVIDCGI